ncbi:hypothetical protein TNCV_2467811 [Trichonephila clavipes]|nr:hypothetical protein TNCV_2467811 [Trichonephila clavipes]
MRASLVPLNLRGAMYVTSVEVQTFPPPRWRDFKVWLVNASSQVSPIRLQLETIPLSSKTDLQHMEFNSKGVVQYELPKENGMVVPVRNVIF